MVANVAKIPWDRIGQAIPAFITLALMPLTYSIAYGVPLFDTPFTIRMSCQVAGAAIEVTPHSPCPAQPYSGQTGLEAGPFFGEYRSSYSL